MLQDVGKEGRNRGVHGATSVMRDESLILLIVQHWLLTRRHLFCQLSLLQIDFGALSLHHQQAGVYPLDLCDELILGDWLGVRVLSHHQAATM